MGATRNAEGSFDWRPEPVLMTVIQISELSVERGGKTVLDNLSLSVATGEIYALLGGNGAGKSTTLSTLLGFLKPSSGSLLHAILAMSLRRSIKSDKCSSDPLTILLHLIRASSTVVRDPYLISIC